MSNLNIVYKEKNVSTIYINESCVNLRGYGERSLESFLQLNNIKSILLMIVSSSDDLYFNINGERLPNSDNLRRSLNKEDLFTIDCNNTFNKSAKLTFAITKLDNSRIIRNYIFRNVN